MVEQELLEFSRIGGCDIKFFRRSAQYPAQFQEKLAIITVNRIYDHFLYFWFSQVKKYPILMPT